MPYIWTSAKEAVLKIPPSKAVPHFLLEKLDPKEPERDRSPEKLQRTNHQVHETRCSAKKILTPERRFFNEDRTINPMLSEEKKHQRHVGVCPDSSGVLNTMTVKNATP